MFTEHVSKVQTLAVSELYPHLLLEVSLSKVFQGVPCLVSMICQSYPKGIWIVCHTRPCHNLLYAYAKYIFSRDPFVEPILNNFRFLPSPNPCPVTDVHANTFAVLLCLTEGNQLFLITTDMIFSVVSIAWTVDAIAVACRKTPFFTVAVLCPPVVPHAPVLKRTDSSEFSYEWR